MVNSHGVTDLLVCEIEAFDWIAYDDYFPYRTNVDKLVKVRLWNSLSIVYESVIRDRVIKRGWQDHLKSLEKR